MTELPDRLIRDVIRAYAAIRDPDDLGVTLERNPLLRSPEFHDLLRQKHLHMRMQLGDTPEFQAFEDKFLFFFSHLQREAYENAIAELDRGDHQGSFPDPQAHVQALVESPWSQHEATLTAIAILDTFGEVDLVLPGLGQERGIFEVDRSHPLRLLDQLRGQEVLERSRVFLERLADRARSLPENLTSVACVLRSRPVGRSECVTVLHRCYVDASADDVLRARLQTVNPHWSADPAVGLVPTELLAIDADIDNVLLNAAGTVLMPERRLPTCLPPSLTRRDERMLRVLEVALTRLEERCAKALGKQESSDKRVYNISYDRDELAQRLRLAQEVVENPDAMSRIRARTMLEEYRRKIAEGEIALDAAVADVRSWAREDPTMPVPPLVFGVEFGGDNQEQLISLALTDAIIDAREGQWAAKAAIAAALSGAYRRMSNVGQAAAQRRASSHFARAEETGESTAALRAAVLDIEADTLLDHGDANSAIGMWRKVLGVYAQAGKDPEARQNSLIVRNKIGNALRAMAQLDEALREFWVIAEDAGAWRDELAGGTNLPLTEEQREFFRRHATYTASGAQSNVGSLYSLALESIRAIACEDGLKASSLGMRAEDAERSRELEALAEFLHAAGIEPQTAVDSELCARLSREAVARFRHALELSESVAGHQYAAIQAEAIASMMLQAGEDPEEALHYAHRAHEHARYSGSEFTYATVDSTLADALLATGQDAKATEALERSLAAQIRARVAAGTDQLRHQEAGAMRETFTRLAGLLIAAQQPIRALETAETIKSNLLALEMSRTLPRLDELDAESPELTTLREKMALRERFMVLLDDPDSGESRRAMRAIETLGRSIEDLRERLMLGHPRFAEWCRWSTVEAFSLDRIRSIAADTSILGFIVGSGGASWRYAAQRDGVDFETCTGTEQEFSQLIQAVSEIHAALAADKYSLKDAHAAFGPLARTFAPIVERLLEGKPRSVIICPDGPTYRIPWALMPVGAGMLLDHAVVYNVYSLSVAAALLERWDRPGSDKPAADGALLVVDPLKGTVRELPGARAEARRIAEVLGSERCVTLEGNQATIEAVAKACSGRAIVHFACHGSFGGYVDSAGQLLLAPGGEATTASGVLTPSHITERLDLRAAMLANLSACEVGLVSPELATEVDGIGRACLASGADGVLASLWPLRDNAAAAFSSRYYKHLGTSRDPATALQATQLECRAEKLGKAMSRPAHWAGYFYVGVPGGKLASPAVRDAKSRDVKD